MAAGAIGAFMALTGNAVDHDAGGDAPALASDTGALTREATISSAFSDADYAKAAPSRRSGTAWPSVSSDTTTTVSVQKDITIAEATPYYFGTIGADC